MLAERSRRYGEDVGIVCVPLDQDHSSNKKWFVPGKTGHAAVFSQLAALIVVTMTECDYLVDGVSIIYHPSSVLDAALNHKATADEMSIHHVRSRCRTSQCCDVTTDHLQRSVDQVMTAAMNATSNSSVRGKMKDVYTSTVATKPAKDHQVLNESPFLLSFS